MAELKEHPLRDLARQIEKVAAEHSTFSQAVKIVMACTDHLCAVAGVHEANARQIDAEKRLAEADKLHEDYCRSLLNPKPDYRHKKRGTFYKVVGRSTLQSSKPVFEGTELISYVGQKGDSWSRPTEEFGDGRFEPIIDDNFLPEKTSDKP